MTLAELSRHFKLRERIERNNETIAGLRLAAYPCAQKLDGMPHAQGVSDKVGRLAIDIADLEDKNKQLAQELQEAEREIVAFIDTIPDEYLQMIFRLRFLHGMTWGEVAGALGGRNTEVGVKSACYRYLKTQYDC